VTRLALCAVALALAVAACGGGDFLLDSRDPCFYTVNGQLAIKALTRLPITSARDSNVDTIAVGTQSRDGGATWSALASRYVARSCSAARCQSST
jgi:hypothetical protein